MLGPNIELAIKTKWLLSNEEALTVLVFFDQNELSLPGAGNMYLGKFEMDASRHAVYILKAGSSWTLKAISDSDDPAARAMKLSSLCDHVSMGDPLPFEFTKCDDCGKLVKRASTDD